MLSTLSDGVRYSNVNREKMELARTMMATNGIVASIVDVIRKTMDFKSMEMFPEYGMSEEEKAVHQKWYAAFAEEVLMTKFVVGNYYFAAETADVTEFIREPEPSEQDISQTNPRKRPRPNSKTRQILVPVVPDDSECLFRMKIRATSKLEILFRWELEGQNPEEVTPKQIVAVRSPDQPDSNGELRSKCAGLIFDYLSMMQNQNFQTRANFSNCQPITVVHKEKKPLDAATGLGPSAGESRYIYPGRLANERGREQLDSSKAIQLAQKQAVVGRDGPKDLTHYWNNPLIMTRNQQPFRHHVEDGILVLPDDHRMGQQPLLAQAPSNMHDLEHRFVLTACMRFGVPTSMIFYGSGRTTTIASETERGEMISTARYYKREMEEFLERVFSHLNEGRRCKFKINLNTIHDVGVYEDCYRMGVMTRQNLAESYSKVLAMDLQPVPETEVPITMPSSKMNLYLAKQKMRGKKAPLEGAIKELTDKAIKADQARAQR
jgi:hypothetical protein